MASGTSSYENSLQRRYANELRAKLTQAPIYQGMGSLSPNSFQGGAASSEGINLDDILQSSKTVNRNILNSPAFGFGIDLLTSGLHATTQLAGNVASTIRGVTGNYSSDPGKASFERSLADRWRDIGSNPLNLFKHGDGSWQTNPFTPLSGLVLGYGAKDFMPNREVPDSPGPTAAAANKTRNSHMFWSDVIDSVTGKNIDDGPGYRAARSGLGFAGDVVLDPINLVPGGVVAKAGRVASLTAKGSGPAGQGVKALAQEAGEKLPVAGARIADFGTRYADNWRKTLSGLRSQNKHPIRTGGKIADFSDLPARNLPPGFNPLSTEIGELTALKLSTEDLINFSRRPVPSKPATPGSKAMEDLIEGDTSVVEKLAPDVKGSVARRATAMESLINPFRAGVKQVEVPQFRPEVQAVLDKFKNPKTGKVSLKHGKKTTAVTTERLIRLLAHNEPKPGSLSESAHKLVRDGLEEAGGMAPLEATGPLKIALPGGKTANVSRKLAQEIEDSLSTNLPTNLSDEALETYLLDTADELAEKLMAEIPGLSNNDIIAMLGSPTKHGAVIRAMEREGADAVTSADVSFFGDSITQEIKGLHKLDPKDKEWIAFRKQLDYRVKEGDLTSEERKRLRTAKTFEELESIKKDIANSEIGILSDEAVATATMPSPTKVEEIVEHANKPLRDKNIENMSQEPFPKDPEFDHDLNRTVLESLKTTIDSKANKAVLETTHKYRSPSTKAFKTDEAAGVGGAIHQRVFNSPNIVLMASHVIKDIRQYIIKKFPLGADFKSGRAFTKADWKPVNEALRLQAQYMATYAPAALRLAEKIFRDRGGAMILGHGTKGPQYYMSDVMDFMTSNGLTEYLVDLRVNVHLGNLLDAFEVVIGNSKMAAGSDGLTAAIKKALIEDKGYALEGGTYYNNLASPEKSWGALKSSNLGRQLTPEEIKNYPSDSVAKKMSELADLIRQKAADNAGEHLTRTGAESVAMSDKFINDFLEALNNPTASVTDLVDLTQNAPHWLRKASDEIGANPSALESAVNKAEDALADTLSPTAARTAETIVNNVDQAKRAAEGGKNSPDVNKARANQFDEAVAEAQPSFLEIAPEMASDFSVSIEMSLDFVAAERWTRGGLGAKFMNFFREHFAAHAGGDIISGMTATVGKAQTGLREIVQEQVSHLVDVHKRYGDKALNNVGGKIFAGVDPSTLNAAEREIFDALSPQFNVMWDWSNKASLGRNAYGNMALQNGIPFEAMNAAARRRGKPYIKYDREAAEALAKVNGTHWFDELASQWRTWGRDTDMNVVDFLMDNIVVHYDAITYSSVSDQLFSLATKHGAYSAKPKHGWVKIARDPDGAIGHFMPDGYYHPEVVNSMRNAEKMLVDINSKMPWLFEQLAPFLDIWKGGMTIWRPGHHGRNLAGDIFLTQYATGRMRITDVWDAARVSKSANIWNNDFNFDQVIKALENPEAFLKGMEGKATYIDRLRFLSGQRDKLISANGQDKILTAKLSGGNVDLTANQIYEALQARGALPSARLREGILSDALNEGGTRSMADKVDRARDTIAKTLGTNRRIEEKVVRFSKARDHYGRIHHAIAYMKKNSHKYDDIHKLLDDVADDIYKWHPSGTGFTRKEQVIYRNLFPFYMWTRKAIPLMVESMMTNPGRVLTAPKALYNFTESLGIDLDSLGNPFPLDQQFPSWMKTGMMGTTYRDAEGNYKGISFGNPMDDLAGQFLQGRPMDGLPAFGPAKGIMGMANPFLKGPLEGITGTNFSTGAPILDMSDHIDSQIPGVGWFNRLTGVSPTGVLGVDKAFGSGYTPWNSNVERGLQNPLDPDKLISYLTGMSVLNQSQPNYIRGAEMERMRDAGRY